ncbi:MAG: mycofactocin biosynthesis glycosyltransferase MftF [Beutenbergiaceae bacterium]
MSDSLPDGFTVRLGRHTQITDGAVVLVGGMPTRVMRLSPPARAAMSGHRLVVRDEVSSALARRLLASGLADPEIGTLPQVPLSQLTVVIPVYQRVAELDRLLASLPPGLAEVIVVDDASPAATGIASVALRHGAQLHTFSRNRGVAAARNAGLVRVATPYVAFVDSDAVLDPGCLQVLLRHFADPLVAMVAPRVRGLERDAPNLVTRYENARSSLDLGDQAASVRPGGRVTWVSSTCLVARVDRLGGGFDESMRVAEDVDLVWRLVAQGWTVRFEPQASVQHQHRTRLRTWLARKFFYGTGTDLLARRHPREIAPVRLAPWGIVVLAAGLAQRRWSIPVVVLTTAVTAWRIRKRLPRVDRPWLLALRLAGQGLVAVTDQGMALLVRHWWPVTLLGSLFSSRLRRAALLAAVADAGIEYLRLRPRMDPIRFGALRRADDLGYGAGAWWSAIRGGSGRGLLPAVITRQRS